MNHIKSFQVLLAQGATRRISKRNREEQTIYCRKGTVWLTVVGDARDYVFSAGEKIDIPKGTSDVLVESLSGDIELDVRLCS